jgi:phosphoribosyl-ATP pyrophosphohydrolase/phosphoribosyl-AMP cyclohydrolase
MKQRRMMDINCMVYSHYNITLLTFLLLAVLFYTEIIKPIAYKDIPYSLIVLCSNILSLKPRVFIFASMKVDFAKFTDGLAPAIVQDFQTQKVLMLGFMNEEALKKTEETGLITFYSRSKNRLWTKGEESGNHLQLRQIFVDCDKDTILLKADPKGPVCHTGADTCWAEKNHSEDFLFYLEDIIRLRRKSEDKNSYVKSLFDKGINKIAQKVGEEAVELVIESKDVNQALFLGEAADLLFHYLVLLQAKDCSLQDVLNVLKERHQHK